MDELAIDPALIPDPPVELLEWQDGGIYGIAYDIYTNPTEHEPPHGWHAWRGRYNLSTL